MDKFLRVKFEDSFHRYEETMSAISNGLTFWNYMLSDAIKGIKNNRIAKQLPIFTSTFSAYDIPIDGTSGKLKTPNKHYRIMTEDLETEKKDLFDWIKNYSIVRAYTASEQFLLESIHVHYFGKGVKSKTRNKKYYDQISSLIMNSFPPESIPNKTNNGHIISFLEFRNKEFEIFSKLKVRINLSNSWKDFFEFVSILRNSIAHNGIKINNDALNKIRQRSKSLFQQTFEVEKYSSDEHYLKPKDGQFENLLGLVNDFTLNSVKFIFGETNFKMYDMHDIFRVVVSSPYFSAGRS